MFDQHVVFICVWVPCILHIANGMPCYWLYGEPRRECQLCSVEKHSHSIMLLWMSATVQNAMLHLLQRRVLLHVIPLFRCRPSSLTRCSFALRHLVATSLVLGWKAA